MSLVAIVGRPNVGKSTLFNRLVGERKAIVDATAGTTRDRHYGKTDWNGKEFSVIDTGGYTVNSEDIFEDEIRRQVLLAIDEADVILFLVEVRTGITDLDMLMADILRRTSKKVILVCNKVDNNDQIYSSHEFYALGTGRSLLHLVDVGNRHGRPDGRHPGRPARRSRRRGGRRPAPHHHRRASQRREVVAHQRPAGRGAQHRDLDRRNHPRLDPHPLQQIRDGFLPRRHGRHAQEGQDDGGPRILLGDALDPRHREFGRLHPDDRRPAGTRIAGPEHPQPDRPQPQGMRDRGQQMGPDREGQQHDEGVDGVPEKETRAVQRHSDHLHLGAEQTAHLRRAANRDPRLPVAQTPHPDLGAQRLPAAADRELPAPRDQGQIHQDQVRDPASDADAAVRVLRQPAAVHQGALPPLPRKQHAGKIGIFRECRCRSTSDRNKAAPRTGNRQKPLLSRERFFHACSVRAQYWLLSA